MSALNYASSSDGSEDEEENCRNFDAEAAILIQKGTLPKKSAERYELVYSTYQKWKEANTKSLSEYEENNLVIYFTELMNKLKPPTLWSIWSMLKTTLQTHENKNIKEYLNLKTLIKNNAKGYKPKKAYTLKWAEVMKFMAEAVDQVYLAIKVTTIHFLIKILFIICFNLLFTLIFYRLF